MLDRDLMAKKAADEAALREQLGSPEKQKQYGAIWDNIAAAERDFKTFFVRYAYTEQNHLASDLFGIAHDLVRLTEEKTKPNEKRLREFRESNLQSLELHLFSPAPIYDGLEEALMTAALERTRKNLGDNDPYVKTLFGGKSA